MNWYRVLVYSKKLNFEDHNSVLINYSQYTMYIFIYLYVYIRPLIKATDLNWLQDAIVSVTRYLTFNDHHYYGIGW